MKSFVKENDASLFYLNKLKVFPVYNILQCELKTLYSGQKVLERWQDWEDPQSSMVWGWDVPTPHISKLPPAH